MRQGQLICAFAVAASLCPICACGRSRRASGLDAAHRQTSPIHLQLRCEPQSELLQCEALASDEPSESENAVQNVTDAVQWTSSNIHDVVVQRGRIHVNRGRAATITATWIEAANKPSASVMVVGDPFLGETRQGYVLEGKVVSFPLADPVGGARVNLIDENGVALSVTTTSGGELEGQFRFGPVSAGTYSLRVVSAGYRSTEKTVVLPDDKVYTLTLLPEPKGRS
jgi:hypothetical protein